MLDEGFKAWQAHVFLLSKGPMSSSVSNISEAQTMCWLTTTERGPTVKHEELNAIFVKIDDCDFAGARTELHALAQELAHKGELEYSDFLADYAYRSSRIANSVQQTMPWSESDKKLKRLEKDYKELAARQDKIIIDAYEYFKEYEKIATTTPSHRTVFSFFNLEHDDNFPAIDAFMKKEKQTYITPENITSVFVHQLKFYARLEKAGVTTFLNLAQRITNIESGKYWRYVELRKKTMAQKKAIDEIDSITERLNELEKQADEIRSYYWLNDHSSAEFRNDFIECLEAFHKTQANSSNQMENDDRRF
ncbi:hypothetical protein ALQ37_200096 [Pseudomonas syringae pv. aptata]|uniref:Uncharacterized protein n=1 Tax=Pseudomonas syringae pv. aptata TaxID=83167 RepID=A0A3M3X7J8_PSEAP|nr:hypothetical protein [Pseudomonas syringae]RMO65383.1 hypothetical protein ALQ37_200096 [Pseudomonas syringae pv. aptata]